MPRFITRHDAPGVTLDKLEELREQVNEVVKTNPDIIYYRSWVNIDKGVIMSEIDAPSASLLKRWLHDLGLTTVDMIETNLIGQAGMTTLTP